MDSQGILRTGSVGQSVSPSSRTLVKTLNKPPTYKINSFKKYYSQFRTYNELLISLTIEEGRSCDGYMLIQFLPLWKHCGLLWRQTLECCCFPEPHQTRTHSVDMM